MEESREILLKSLDNSGVIVPPNVISIQDLEPAMLVSICAQSLNLIDETTSFPTSLPDSSVADQYKICMDIASGIKNLGYLGDLSFHQFLYPSEEDSYKLIRFLVERLGGKFSDVNNFNDSKEVGKDDFESYLEDWTGEGDENGVDVNFQKIEAKFDDLRLMSEARETVNTKARDASLSKSHEAYIIPQEVGERDGVDVSSSGAGKINNDGFTCVSSSEDPLGAGRNASRNEEAAVHMDEDVVDVSSFSAGKINSDGLTSVSSNEDPLGARGNGSRDEEAATHMNEERSLIYEQKEASLKDQSSETSYEIKKTQDQENIFSEGMTENGSDLKHLEEELELLKVASEMAFDDQHPFDFYLEQLKEKESAKKHHLAELKSQWEPVRKSLEEEKKSLQKSLYANIPEAEEKFQKLSEIELETQSILSEIKRSEDELSKLSSDLEKQPKLASRKSYIDRIKEITKNSGKQNADIENILKDTRELQLASNSIQERLHRTYAIVDEMVFREAKKDPVGRQAYRLLTSIHESFEQISEKILATDRIRREVAEREKKLATMASRSLNSDKLQADLDGIRRENEQLEKCLQDNV